MKSQRLDQIEDYVLEHRNVSLDTLCETFHVSKNTIRRDIELLLKRSSIVKVYGGVAALKAAPEYPFLSYKEHNESFISEKRELCRQAASLVTNGDIIYIDSDSTCLDLIDFLSDSRCTILTNSLLILNKAVSCPSLDVISVPGKLNRETLTFTGPDIQNYLEAYNISTAFISCTGVTIKNGLTTASTEEYITKKTIADRSEKLVLLADHSRFGRVSLMTCAPLKALDTLITDQKLPEDYQNFFQEQNIRVITPEQCV